MESKKRTAVISTELVQIRALLVDDEIGAIKTLRNMLGQYCPQVQICGAVLSVQEAVTAAAALQPEVVFLDIQMPPFGSGFDFLRQCPDYDFGVIFTTAYPKYAVEAINTVQPWAYLIKPYSVADLKKAVNVAEEKIQAKARLGNRHASLIVQDSRKGSLVIRADKILYCKASGSFSDIYVLSADTIEKIISSRNLGEHEWELPENKFCRTHHSYLVNLAYVERFERTGGNGVVHLSPGGHQAAVSVAKMDEVQQALEAYALQHRGTPGV